MNTQVDRSLIIKLIVMAAVVLCVVWIMNNTYWAEQTIPKNLSGEAATNPFYGAQHLTDALGAHSEWKHLLGDLPPTNAVIVLGSWNWDVIEQRRDKLQKWVSEGGRLVVDESLAISADSLKQWGLEYKAVRKKKSDDESDDSDTENDDEHEDADNDESEDDKGAPLVPFTKHGTFCKDLELINHMPGIDSQRTTYQLCSFDFDRFIISDKPVQWALRNEHGLQAARVALGRGSITVFNAAPFGNRTLLNGEHGLLFVAATQLHRGDAIYFLMDEEGTPLLELIWIYGAPVVTLTALLIAAALWRNGTRFGPLAHIRDSARRSLAEQIIGTGRFILRFNGGHDLHAATVRALVDAAKRHIPHYDRLATLDRAVALAAATGLDADDLDAAIHHQRLSRSAELRHAIATLEHARRILNNEQLSNQSRRSHAS